MLESINAPLAPTYVFYNKIDAFEWSLNTTYPKVFKLRNGSGSDNVRLIGSKQEALKLIRKAFSGGFKQYNAWGSLRERVRLYRLNKTDLLDVIKGVLRFVHSTDYSRLTGKEIGYVYFQDYIPLNKHDTRVVVIGDKAFAIKRMVRKNDFRASGSGQILYSKQLFDLKTIKLSFDIALELKAQCIAFDYVRDQDKDVLVEISYGFSPSGYDPCPGYWDINLNWYEGKFDPYGWMVEDLVNSMKCQTTFQKHK